MVNIIRSSTIQHGINSELKKRYVILERREGEGRKRKKCKKKIDNEKESKKIIKKDRQNKRGLKETGCHVIL